MGLGKDLFFPVPRDSYSKFGHGLVPIEKDKTKSRCRCHEDRQR